MNRSEVVASLGASARVLDVGGWHRPLNEATHVVDLFPWETRGGRVCLERQPGERFDRDTWTQVDFLAAGLRLPFEDKWFDWSVCSHTLEDLADPFPVLREILRVSRSGYLEVPSRLHEQTAGVRDRASTKTGHPHHHWIVDLSPGRATFCSKQDSMRSSAAAVPLLAYERECRQGREPIAGLVWHDTLSFEVVRGDAASAKAVAFAGAVPTTRAERVSDRAIRLGRRIRDAAKGRKDDAAAWPGLVELSRPYSRIPLVV